VVDSWEAVESEAERVIAEHNATLGVQTASQIREFLRHIRGRTPVPEVGPGYWRTSLSVSWSNRAVEIFGDHLEVYRFCDGATHIEHLAHAPGMALPAALQAELGRLPESRVPVGVAGRSEWGLDPDFLTVNHGSYGATPLVVLAEQDRWRKRMEAQLTRFFFLEVPKALRDAAATLALFLGAAADDVVFVPNATTGANAVLRSLRLEPGDEILHVSHVYNAVRNTIAHVAEQAGAKAVVADIPFPRPETAAIVKNVERAIGRRTRIAVIDHITSPSGMVMPIAEIVRLCHAAGVPVLVDGAHGAGQVALDLRQLDADWYVGTCHKWLCAPKGCGFLYARADRRAELHPVTISHGYGGGFTTEFDWTGTMDPSAYLSLPAAIGFFERLGGLALMERNRRLAAEAATLLADALRTEVGVLPEMAGSMGLVRLPLDLEAKRSEAVRVRQALQAAGTDAPVHPLDGALWLRLSAYAYNELADYRRLAALLPAVLKQLSD
jgi:isopenicillin-N epimerase